MHIILLVFRVFFVGLSVFAGGVLGDVATLLRLFRHKAAEIDAPALQQLPAVRVSIDEAGPYIVGECEVVA